MNYQFDNLVPFLLGSRKLSDMGYYSYYSHYDSVETRRSKREALEFMLWTTKSSAHAESENNIQVLAERCRSVGFDHFVYYKWGIQFFIADKLPKSKLIDKLELVLGDYIQNLDAAYQNFYSDSTAPQVSINHSYNHFATDEGSFVGLREYQLGIHSLKPGLYDTQTLELIKNRGKILETFWKYGFLTVRGRLLRAANQKFGSKSDVFNLSNVSTIIDNLPSGSPLRASLIAGIRKITRDCDWPQSQFPNLYRYY